MSERASVVQGWLAPSSSQLATPPCGGWPRNFDDDAPRFVRCFRERDGDDAINTEVLVI